MLVRFNVTTLGYDPGDEVDLDPVWATPLLASGYITKMDPEAPAVATPVELLPSREETVEAREATTKKK